MSDQQAPHFTTIFEKILQTIIFYVNKNASYILVTICEPSRIPSRDVVTFLKVGVPQRSRAHFTIKNWVCPHRSLPLSDPKTGCARAHCALKVTTPLIINQGFQMRYCMFFCHKGFQSDADKI